MIQEYYVLATKRVELRGTVKAYSLGDAEKKVKDHWHIYDLEDTDAVAAHTSEAKGDNPKIAEYDSKITIIHIENIKKVCKECGHYWRKHKEGKCPI